MSEHKIIVEISGEGEKVVQKVFHELVKETQNAGRYGHNVSVRQVDKSEFESAEGGFD